MKRIALVMSENAYGESRKNFISREKAGFWDDFVRPGPVLDIGYKGGNPNADPIFVEAIGLDIGTPGYNGKDIPFGDLSVGTIHACHLLEHIEDYQYFLRESLRVLMHGGTLILMVPLLEAYENKLNPPSRFNRDHKRFYTASRLCQEFEFALPRNSYRILHLQEKFNLADFGRMQGTHAIGPAYEIECVIEKTTPGAIYV